MHWISTLTSGLLVYLLAFSLFANSNKNPDISLIRSLRTELVDYTQFQQKVLPESFREKQAWVEIFLGQKRNLPLSFLNQYERYVALVEARQIKPEAIFFLADQILYFGDGQRLALPPEIIDFELPKLIELSLRYRVDPRSLRDLYVFFHFVSPLDRNSLLEDFLLRQSRREFRRLGDYLDVLQREEWEKPPEIFIQRALSALQGEGLARRARQFKKFFVDEKRQHGEPIFRDKAGQECRQSFRSRR